MCMKRMNFGQTIVEFILLVLMIAVVAFITLERIGWYRIIGSVAGELVVDNHKPMCRSSTDDVYDPRADRYRNTRSGRFARTPCDK